MSFDKKIISSASIYNGHILNLRVDTLLIDKDHEAKREIVEHKNAVAVLAVKENGNILFVSQYRHAAGETILEIPAGLVDDGETPLEAASRELQEEIGYRPENLSHICSFYTSPGFSTELIDLYFADKLTCSKLPEDDDEQIEIVEIPLNDAMKMIASGKIKDSKTITACFWLNSKQ